MPAVASTALEQSQSQGHVTTQHTLTLHSSKHKSWPPRKQKEKSTKESGSSLSKKQQKPHLHQSSPSIPSSSAADFPLQRTAGSHQEVTVASQAQASVGESGRHTKMMRCASVVSAEEEGGKKTAPMVAPAKAPEQVSRYVLH